MAEAKKKEEPDEVREPDAEVVKEPEKTSAARDIPVSDGAPDEKGEKSESEDDLDEVQILEAKMEELEGQKLRALADLDNYRKRMTRQFESVIRTANDNLLGELLGVVDNLERALEHSDGENDAEGEVPTVLRGGTELIYQQMNDLLARYEVRPIEAVGHTFDPNYHEALMQVVSDEYDEGIVVTQVSKGYMVGERVLRHAKVAVSKGKTEENGQKT